mmetsp:Transcript_62553/g.186073  ORF Transcript_62553/g.186073 Transcript_62553/m.186073 type:complete len:290 (-) Transcript_62553:432-1301(-)
MLIAECSPRRPRIRVEPCLQRGVRASQLGGHQLVQVLMGSKRRVLLVDIAAHGKARQRLGDHQTKGEHVRLLGHQACALGWCVILRPALLAHACGAVLAEAGDDPETASAVEEYVGAPNTPVAVADCVEANAVQICQPSRHVGEGDGALGGGERLAAIAECKTRLEASFFYQQRVDKASEGPVRADSEQRRQVGVRRMADRLVEGACLGLQVLFQPPHGNPRAKKAPVEQRCSIVERSRKVAGRLSELFVRKLAQHDRLSGAEVPQALRTGIDGPAHSAKHHHESQHYE